MFSAFLEAIWPWKKPQFHHQCLLVGPVIDGEPVAPYNRRVIHLKLGCASLETGDVGAVWAGRGKVSEEEFLGRITVPLEGNLTLVQDWVKDIFDKGDEGMTMDAVVEGVKTNSNNLNVPQDGTEVIQLDIFKGTVLNKMKDQVFIFKEPTSFQ